MKKTIDASDLKAEFESYNRDYYSQEGYAAMLEYYDEYDEKMELDVIAICCEWSEYTQVELMSEYDYIFDAEELAEEDDGYKMRAIIQYLNDETTVIELTYSYLVMAF